MCIDVLYDSAEYGVWWVFPEWEYDILFYFQAYVVWSSVFDDIFSIHVFMIWILPFDFKNRKDMNDFLLDICQFNTELAYLRFYFYSWAPMCKTLVCTYEFMNVILDICL